MNAAPGPGPIATPSVTIGDGRLRVVFSWQGDRYGHVVEARADGEDAWQTVLRSVEGTPSESWPASPPLQQAHREDRPGGAQLILAVGMAGRSHWSASIAFDPEGATLEFDLACRMWEEPMWLGSRYQSAEQTSGIESEATIGQQRQVADSREFSVLAGAGAIPRTVRWMYRLTRVTAVWKKKED